MTEPLEDISRLVPGAKVRRGKPGNEWHGVVVFNNTIGMYSDDFPKEHWAYLGNGFMIKYDQVGLVFCEFVDDEQVVS